MLMRATNLRNRRLGRALTALPGADRMSGFIHIEGSAMRELRINLVMLLSFCATLPLAVLGALLVLSETSLTTVHLVLAGAASAAFFGLLYALGLLTRCLAQVDGAAGK